MSWKQSAYWRAFWVIDLNVEDVIKNTCWQEWVVMMFGLYIVQLYPQWWESEIVLVHDLMVQTLEPSMQEFQVLLFLPEWHTHHLRLVKYLSVIIDWIISPMPSPVLSTIEVARMPSEAKTSSADLGSGILSGSWVIDIEGCIEPRKWFFTALVRRELNGTMVNGAGPDCASVCLWDLPSCHQENSLQKWQCVCLWLSSESATAKAKIG